MYQNYKKNNFLIETFYFTGESENMRLVTKVTLSDMWYNPHLRQPLIIAVMVMLSQQFSGINAAISFSTDIFKSAGLNDTAALYSTMGND